MPRTADPLPSAALTHSVELTDRQYQRVLGLPQHELVAAIRGAWPPVSSYRVRSDGAHIFWSDDVRRALGLSPGAWQAKLTAAMTREVGG
jgi:hypothetical protein